MSPAAWDGECFAWPSLPTMISPAERRYLHWLGRCLYRGEGHVLEMGPWLGGSTWCLAAGLAAGGRLGRFRLHAVDNFVWRAFMEERAPLGLAPGASFRGHTAANLAAFDFVALHEASLPDDAVPGDPEAAAYRGSETPAAPFRWDPGEPLEILFVDGAKSWLGFRALLSETTPSLLPGRSLIVCQDYKYWECYWVPMLLARLAPWLEPHHDVAPGGTFAFRVRDAIPAEAVASLPRDVAAADAAGALKDLDAAIAQVAPFGDPLAPAVLALQRVAFLAHRGDLDAACAEFERAQADWPLGRPTLQLDRARRYLAEVWARTPSTRRSLALALRARRAVARVLG